MALNVKGKASKTLAHVEKDGAKIIEEAAEKPVALPDGPTANVNVNLGARIGLPNYSDVRVGCSITLPCLPTEEGISEAYAAAEAWCFEKVDVLTEKALAEDDESDG